MLGLSFDSASNATNFAHRRWPRGGKPPSADAPSLSLCSLRNAAALAAALAAEHNIPLKINTVVTSRNQSEDVSAAINDARPVRWKVFQVLPLEGENMGPGALNDVSRLLVSRVDFDAFVERNRAGLLDSSILKYEPNGIMQSSYIILDQEARFLDTSCGGKVPSRSILEVGVLAAAKEIGGRFDSAAYLARDGAFFKGANACAAGSPAVIDKNATRVPLYPTSKLRAPAAPSPASFPASEREIEIMFALTPALLSALPRLAAVPATCKTFTDTYYDTADFHVTSRDHWLRTRDATIELKSPSVSAPREHDELRVDFYNEDRAWPAIAAALLKVGISLSAELTAVHDTASRLAAASPTLSSFATITTTRTRFVLSLAGHSVNVDIDEVLFEGAPGSEGYTIGEVELIAAAPGTAPRAALASVMAALGIPAAAPIVRGKVLEYIFRFDAPRWRALGDAGLLLDKLGPTVGSQDV